MNPNRIRLRPTSGLRESHLRLAYKSFQIPLLMASRLQREFSIELLIRCSYDKHLSWPHRHLEQQQITRINTYVEEKIVNIASAFVSSCVF